MNSSGDIPEHWPRRRYSTGGKIPTWPEASPSASTIHAGACVVATRTAGAEEPLWVGR